MELRLYFFEGSPAGLTSRLELEFKGLDYEAVYLPPVAHKFILARKGFEGMSVPALEADGRQFDGTLAISRALEELTPDPPLFPSDAARRRAVEEAERWGEEFQRPVRRLFYAELRRKPSAWARLMSEGQSPRTRIAVRLAAPGLVQFAGIYHGGVAKKARRDLADLPGLLDRIDGWIADGLLDQEQLNAADFEIATNVRLLAAFEDLATFVEGRPAAAHANRVVPGVSWRFPGLLPASWLRS
jgi:glutathione S-transferase